MFFEDFCRNDYFNDFGDENKEDKYYKPEEFHLFKRIKIHNENVNNNFDKIKRLFIAYLIVNPILRIIKLLFSCFLDIGRGCCKGCCSCLNFIYFLAGAINFSLALCILIFSPVYFYHCPVC